MKHLHILVGVALIVVIALLLASCEQKSSTGSGITGPTSPIGNILLTADELELYSIPGEPVTANITATVTDTAGTGLSGVLVRFTTPSFGSISSTQDTTDLDGKVAVVFNSQGQFGLANISASVTSGTETKTGFITIGVYPLTGLATNITLSLIPDILYLATGVDDSIMARVRVFDSLNVGIPGMQVSLSTTLGVITIANTTDNSGTVVTYVHTNEEFGMGLVTASVNTSLPDTLAGGAPQNPGNGEIAKSASSLTTGPANKATGALTFGEGTTGGTTQPPQVDDVYVISDTDTFWVFSVDQQIDTLILTASPGILTVPWDSAGTASITAIVLDQSNTGVAGVPVSFATDLGLLEGNTQMTNSAGMKTVTYKSIANLYGTARVWAVVGNLTDTVNVSIVPTVSNGSLQVFSNTNLIYADGGMTYANITALLKDADNQVISGAPIIFTSNHGTINSPVLTDSSGQAYAVFTGILGFPSFPDSAMLIAKYNPLNIADTLHIMIAPARMVDHIVLNVDQNSMTANGLDSNRVDATVYLEDNALASPGTQVNFTIGGDRIGNFHVPFAEVVQAGTATLYYFAGNNTGVDTLYAEVDGIYSNPVVVELKAGPPSHIELMSDPATLYVNSLEMATVTATVLDTSLNLVEDNWGVYFTTSLGSISPAQAPTLNGVATTYLSPSTAAGGAWVKASVGLVVDSTLVTFEPSTPAYINLSAAYATITVAGVGDTNQTPIYAHVRDAAGNYVGNNIMVHFAILNGGFPFGGVNINGYGIEDSAATIGGIATVVLNAGSNSGPVQIRAWTYGAEGQEISAQQSLVAIVAGPPAFIDINSMSDPQDNGGDTWRVEVSTLVLDALGNEVPNGNPVSYYLIPDTIAQIQGAAYTGNHNWAGDSLAGVAYTTLSYHSDETFAVVTLVAYCMVGADSVIGTQDYQLPLAQGTLELVIDPVAWNFDHPPYGYTTSSPATMECIADLKDGHENPIDDAVIIFFSTKGNFNFYANGPSAYWTSQKITGPNGFAGEPYDSTGYATVWLLTTFNQAFPDPGAITNTAQVHCQVMGYFDVTSSPITVTFEKDAD